ncbi:UDP-2,3-diacylglucosamine diphosphatase LpxI [Rhodobacteraceae bacterium F11138]|nr:UDP-2,3-diacylglucosamine diphosphatase LpxI [Rhodobacteraceae bacterium F11138]
MLALIVGAGGLPAELVRQLKTPPLICALEGFDPDVVKVDRRFCLEQLGTLLSDLRQDGITEICLAGAIRRPVIDPTRIDAATMPLVPVLQQAILSGDDGALRGVISIFENAGFAVRAAHQIAPDLLPAAGCETDRQPEPFHRDDAVRADAIMDALSAVDVGQGCVVHKGQALALESVYGTDWMLDTLVARPDQGGGLLFKAPKMAQDRRVDLPTIGPGTVRVAAAAGLDGVVIQRGGVLVLEHAAVRQACDRAGLFLWIRDKVG